MEIYVGNLPWSVNDQDLADAFSEFGNVERASIIVERPSGRSKGFGFVTMNDAEEGNRAIEAMNGKEMQGRPLKVNEAAPRKIGLHEPTGKSLPRPFPGIVNYRFDSRSIFGQSGTMPKHNPVSF